MKKCLLIINPKAGQKRVGRELVNIIDELNKAGYLANVFITSADKNASYAVSLLTDEDMVICAGGDGTLNQVASGIVDSGKDITIGYIPCGSTNDFATTLGLHRNIKKSIRDIVNGETSKFDVGEFTAVTNNTMLTKHFVYIASFGLFTSASYSTPQEVKNAFGSMAYAFNGMSELLDAKTYKVKHIIDGIEGEGEYILGMVANTLSVGGVMKLDPVDVDLSDGLFEVVLIKKPNTLIEFNNIIDGLMWKDFTGDMFVYKKATKAEFRFNEEVAWSLDGEESPITDLFLVKNLREKITIKK